MKLKFSKRGLARISSLCLGLLLLPSPAETINWGDNVLDTLVTSTGTALVGTYIIQLGVFTDQFGTEVDPASIPTDTWAARFKVFDQASFNPDFGYFTGSAVISRSLVPSEYGRSSYAGADNIDFSNLKAYIWVRNEVTNAPPGLGTEWFLASAGSWVFPQSAATCCDNSQPIDWALSDLGSTTPKYGGQSGVRGPGLYTNPNDSANLQTYTFVPEPGTNFLVGFGGLVSFFVWRKRRSAV